MDLVKQDYVAVPPMVVAGSPQLERSDARIRRAALARLALGYRQLSLAVAETRHRLTLQDVEDGLRQAGIQVFENKDVSRYKAKVREAHYRNGEWATTPIGEYDVPMPEFAIDTALKVKEAIPEAEFYIEHFLHWRDQDPFLSFKVPGVQRRFVIEVWDEPDFIAKRKEEGTA